MSHSRQIESEAAAWLARREGGAPWSADDEAALAAWRAASTAHQVALIRLEAAWKESARLKALGAGIPAGASPDPEQLRRSIFLGRGRFESARAVIPPGRSLVPHGLRGRRRGILALASRRLWVSASAASVLIAALLTAGWFLRSGGTDYRTAVGALKTVHLADGSEVTLNTDTDLTVLLTQGERHVDLRRGEAFFQVAKDPTRPFVVQAAGERVVAVGTEFSVRREGQNLQVIVTDGKVRLEGQGSRGPDAPVAFVPAGHAARVVASEVLVKPEAPAEGEAALSWRRGYLIFHDTSIADAVAEFNRYSTRKIVIEDPAIGSIRIGGNFRSTSSEAFLRLLSDGFPVRVDDRGDEVFLTRP